MLQTVVNQVVGMNWMNEGSLVSCTMRKVAFSRVDAGRRTVELTSGTLHFRRMLSFLHRIRICVASQNSRGTPSQVMEDGLLEKPFPR